MRSILGEIKTKKGKPEYFFDVGFNEGSDEIFIIRGYPKPKDVKKNLLKNKYKEMGI